MFEKIGIEEEDINMAVTYYKIRDDPEVIKIQMNNMKSMGM
jgi:hypothetical protein